MGEGSNSHSTRVNSKAIQWLTKDKASISTILTVSLQQLFRVELMPYIPPLASYRLTQGQLTIATRSIRCSTLPTWLHRLSHPAQPLRQWLPVPKQQSQPLSTKSMKFLKSQLLNVKVADTVAFYLVMGIENT